jgi:hypothetical protein
MKKVLVLGLLAVLVLVSMGNAVFASLPEPSCSPPPPPPPPCECEPKTPGYWKNHDWPGAIEIAGMTISQEEGQAILKQAVRGDKRITMIKALIAAKLNQAVCGPTCIDGTIAAAERWWAAYGGSEVPASSCAWQEGEPLYWALDTYNNDGVCHHS